MFIEKNHNHIFNKGKNILKKDNNNNNQIKSDLNKQEFNFWNWIKGAINPLQNIPIISGIYSSVNSKNSESDRDMIQSSGGGFLYGGPIGAIAGFGTWVFRKIFDKTPTEFALDTLGISKIWKQKGNEVIQTKKNSIKTKVSTDTMIDYSTKPKNNKLSMGIVSKTKELIVRNPELELSTLEKENVMNIQYPKWKPDLNENIKKSFSANKKMQLMYDSTILQPKERSSKFSLKA